MLKFPRFPAPVPSKVLYMTARVLVFALGLGLAHLLVPDCSATTLEEAKAIAAGLEADVEVHPERSLAVLEPLVQQAWDSGDAAYRNYVEWLRGVAQRAHQDYKAVLARADELERIGVAKSDDGLMAVSLLLRVETELSHPLRFKRNVTAAYQRAQASQDPFLRYEAALWSGRERLIAGDRSAARQFYREAVELAREGGKGHRLSNALLLLAGGHGFKAAAESTPLIEAALREAELSGSRYSRCRALRFKAEALRATGEVGQAVEVLKQAAALGQQASYLACESTARANIAEAYRAADKPNLVLVEADRLEALALEGGGRLSMAKELQAWAYTKLGDPQRAARLEKESKILSDGLDWELVTRDQQTYETERDAATLELALKEATLERERLLARTGWGAGMGALALLALGILLFRKRAALARLTAEKTQAEAAREVAEARLRELNAQIEPHFLYNTLANVQALVRQRPDEADGMIGSLIRYLRASLPKMRDLHSTLGQEFERSAAYLDIARIRFGGRLTSAVLLPKELSEVPFPPLVVQTLVENALKHGAEKRAGPVAIELGAAIEGEHVLVRVADTGAGLSMSQGMGLGLRNIRERLAALYGNAAALELAPNEPTGVVATVRVPAPNSSPKSVDAHELVKET